jgi:transposase InsO family protein
MCVLGLGPRVVEAWIYRVDRASGRPRSSGRQAYERRSGLGITHQDLDRVLGPYALYTVRVRNILRAGGVRPLRLPARSPNLNAHAERFVRSVRTECLDHLIILGERHLRCVLADYVDHYTIERPHQGLGNVVPIAAGREHAAPTARAGPITRRTRLGGLLSHYSRKAA